MIKIVLMLSLFASCGYFGFALSNVYVQKKLFFYDFLNFCKTLKNEIQFLKTDIISVFKKVSYKSYFQKFLENLIDVLKKDKMLNNKNIYEVMDKFNALNSDDKLLISEFFCNIGEMGYDEQLSKIKLLESRLNDDLTKYEKESEKAVPMCRKIGILFGALICIVLI